MPHGGYGVLAHHNSHDTPATVDPKSLRDLMVIRRVAVLDKIAPVA
jgi:hypothetical protein